jgi:hypothetical protein
MEDFRAVKVAAPNSMGRAMLEDVGQGTHSVDPSPPLVQQESGGCLEDPTAQDGRKKSDLGWSPPLPSPATNNPA